MSIGRETAAAVERIYPCDRDPVAVSRVRQIGRRLAASLHRPQFAFEFHVVEDAEVNAFALPGGYIYVFKGLLQLVPNDDALASVLAHEIAHVTESHAIRQFEKNVLLSAGISAVLLGTGTGGAVTGAANVVQVLASLAFTRHDEAEADEKGIELMTRSGYNPKAAAEAMLIVKRASGSAKDTPALLRSHPAPDSRIQKLTKMAADLLAARAVDRAQVKNLPAPPPPADLTLPGLDRLEVAPCAWLPLAPGARWAYRLRAAEAESTVTIRVLEAVAAKPEGVYRVECDLGRGVKVVRLYAPAGDRYATRAETAADSTAWAIEGVFAEGEGLPHPGGILRCAGAEKITVPAGEFEAVKVEHLNESGEVAAAAWYAKGIGLVKRLTTATGATEELTGYSLPPR